MNPTRIIDLVKIANSVAGKEKYAISVDDFGCYFFEYDNGFKKMMNVVLDEQSAIDYAKWIINEEASKNGINNK